MDRCHGVGAPSQYLVHLWFLDLSFILESAMLAWLGSDVTGPSTVDMSTHTLTGYSWGAILA